VHTWYDLNGDVTIIESEATTSIYEIKVLRLISSASVLSISVVKTTTAATITIDLPADVQLSGAPISGKYRIKCVDPEGFESFTGDINLGQGSSTVQNQIMSGCDRLYDLVEVRETVDFPYGENGRAWLIRFVGVNADMGQFEIVSSETDPLAGTNLKYFSNTTVPYSSNLFYEPIPFEMLRTYETLPQLIVTVND
jgi:hypothetical protein